MAIRSAFVCDHMETTSAIVCDPAIAIADDRRRSNHVVLSKGWFPYDRRRSQTLLRSAICDPRSYGNQPLILWLYIF